MAARWSNYRDGNPRLCGMEGWDKKHWRDGGLKRPMSDPLIRDWYIRVRVSIFSVVCLSQEKMRSKK